MSGIKKSSKQQIRIEKKIGSQKINGIKKKHSKMGMVSCGFAGTAFLFLGIAVMISFFEVKEGTRLIGGLGICSILLAFMGIKASMKGRRERDRGKLTCNIGMIMNILLLIGLVIIYII